MLTSKVCACDLNMLWQVLYFVIFINVPTQGSQTPKPWGFLTFLAFIFGWLYWKGERLGMWKTKKKALLAIFTRVWPDMGHSSFNSWIQCVIMAVQRVLQLSETPVIQQIWVNEAALWLTTRSPTRVLSRFTARESNLLFIFNRCTKLIKVMGGSLFGKMGKKKRKANIRPSAIMNNLLLFQFFR